MDNYRDIYALVAELPQPRAQDIPTRAEADLMAQKLETYLLFSRDRHVPRVLYDSSILPQDSRKVGGITALVPILVKEQRKRGETIWNAYTKWRMAGFRFEGQHGITKKERAQAGTDRHEWGARMKMFQQEWADPEVRKAYRERIYAPQQQQGAQGSQEPGSGAIPVTSSSAEPAAIPLEPSSKPSKASKTSTASRTSRTPKAAIGPDADDLPPPVPMRDPEPEPPKPAPIQPEPKPRGRPSRAPKPKSKSRRHRSPTPESESSSGSDKTGRTGMTAGTEATDRSSDESSEDGDGDIRDTFVGGGRSSYLRALGVPGY